MLLGNGDGSFRPAYSATQLVSLAIGSLGDTGQPEFVFSNQSLDRVVAKQNAFQVQGTVVGDNATGLRQPGPVVLDDLNGDGIPDLIVANSGSNNVLVYPGLPDGNFGPALNGGRGFFTGTNPAGITVADIDGDGRTDLVVANKGSNDISILLNRKQGDSITFVPGPRLKTGSGPTATVVRDVNSDGIPDILVSDSQSNDVRLLTGRGLGFFNDTNPTIVQTGMAPGPLFVGNFAGRFGQLDLVTLNAGSNTLSFVPDINGGNVVAQSIPSGGQVPIAAVEMEFGRGINGLLVANNGNGRLALFLGETAGLVLASRYDKPGLHPTALAMDDAGEIFVGFEGVEFAILVTLGLGIASGPGESGGGGVGSSVLPTGPNDQQVALLQSLNESSPAVVVTLLSVIVETTSATAALSDQNITGEEAVAVLPNQVAPPNPGPLQGGDGAGSDVENDQAAAAPRLRRRGARRSPTRWCSSLPGWTRRSPGRGVRRAAVLFTRRRCTRGPRSGH